MGATRPSAPGDALSDSGKSPTLLNIVKLRYAGVQADHLAPIEETIRLRQCSRWTGGGATRKALADAAVKPITNLLGRIRE